MPTENDQCLTIQFVENQIILKVTFNLADKRIKIKDVDGVDYRIEDFTQEKLTDYNTAMTAVLAKADTLFNPV